MDSMSPCIPRCHQCGKPLIANWVHEMTQDGDVIFLHKGECDNEWYFERYDPHGHESLPLFWVVQQKQQPSAIIRQWMLRRHQSQPRA